MGGLGSRSKVTIGIAALAVVVATVFFFTRTPSSDDAAAKRDASTSGTTAPEAKSTTTDIDPELIEASGFGDPAAIEIPDADNDAVAAYLAGDGAPLLTLRADIAPLLVNGSPTVEDCETLASELANGPSPEDLMTAATGVPDEPTRDLLTTLVAATPRALAACGDADLAPRAELAWQVAVLDRRLADIGATGN